MGFFLYLLGGGLIEFVCVSSRSGSAPVDLSMLQRQLLSGHYESLDTFHSDMLKVFHCAEVSFTQY